MRDSSDPRDRVIAELQERFSSFEQQLLKRIGQEGERNQNSLDAGYRMRESGVFIISQDNFISIDLRQYLDDKQGQVLSLLIKT
jgi:hypothetical protein